MPHGEEGFPTSARHCPFRQLASLWRRGCGTVDDLLALADHASSCAPCLTELELGSCRFVTAGDMAGAFFWDETSSLMVARFVPAALRRVPISEGTPRPSYGASLAARSDVWSAHRCDRGCPAARPSGLELGRYDRGNPSLDLSLGGSRRSAARMVTSRVGADGARRECTPTQGADNSHVTSDFRRAPAPADAEEDARRTRHDRECGLETDSAPRTTESGVIVDNGLPNVVPLLDLAVPRGPSEHHKRASAGDRIVV